MATRPSAVTATMQSEPLTIAMILEHGATWNATSRVWTLRDVGGGPGEGRVDETTFADIGRSAQWLAGGLSTLGIGPGDVVGSYMWNTAEHLVAYLAVPSMGAVLHTANIRLSAEQNAYAVEATGDRVLIVDADLLPEIVEQLAHMPTVEVVVVNGHADLASIERRGKRAITFEALLSLSTGGFRWPEIDEWSAANVCFTTGTTGNPKGVAYSHRSTWLHSLSLGTMNALRLGAGDRAMIVVPMFHANAWGYPYAAFWSGAEMVLPGRFVRPPVLVELIERFGVNFANGVPTVWNDVLRYLEEDPGHDISTLDRLVVGGASAPTSLIERFEDRHGVHVVQGWGMTETSPLVSVARPPRGSVGGERMGYLASQGRVLPGVRIRLVNPETGSVLPADGVAVGELELRGPWIAGSYLVEGDGSEKFHDGWLRTGDVGTLDPAGFVRLTDRTKDVIKSGGEWISSVALENLLAGHPDVAEVAVIGVPDERWDERPCAVVVGRAGAVIDPTELRQWLMGQVLRWWLPERWSVVEVLPRTSVGKVDKRLLRALYADGKLDVTHLAGGSKAGRGDRMPGGTEVLEKENR
ncbi:MAG TPA: long-chain fatty acid--CoA ligase [Acidimicrobiales bacterium]|nr:long-chain fatty acid--CoA ligase [Acidimicrobiales bacterium]